MAYLLKRILYKRDEHGEIETNEKGDLIRLGWEYKYYSAQYNNRLFEYPKTIDNNKTLNEILTNIEKILKEQSWLERPSTEWKFVRYLHYEIVIFRLQSTIGYTVSLPLHFYEDSNKKNVIKFENLKDNLCFWRYLAAYIHPEQKDYRRLETPTKELCSNFYGKKYEVSYEGVKYLEYRKFADADIDESEYEKAIDEIDFTKA